MSGLAPVILSTVLAGASSLQGMNQAKTQSRAAAAQARLQLASMEEKRRITTRDEARDLKRKLATQRARFGASGLLSSSSADAVLDGFRAESEKRIDDENRSHNLDLAAVNQRLTSTRSSNTFAANSAILRGLKRL